MEGEDFQTYILNVLRTPRNPIAYATGDRSSDNFGFSPREIEELLLTTLRRRVNSSTLRSQLTRMKIKGLIEQIPESNRWICSTNNQRI